MDYDPMLLESRLPYPKTLDETVLVARAQEHIQSGFLKIVIDGGSSGMKTTDGMEAASFDLRNSTCEDGGDAKTQSAENDRLTALTKPDGEDRVTKQQHGGSDGGAPAGGSDEGADAKAGGEKKRKRRSKDWGVETEMLLKALLQKTKSKNRSESEPRWEAIAKKVPGRTGDECRRRMETLKKSYKTSREYCDDHKKEFSELDDGDFGNTKLATRLTESWFNFMRGHCPPRSCKKRRDEGAGSLLANGVPVSCASWTVGNSGERGVQYRGVESTKVVETTPDQVLQSKRPLEAFEVVFEVAFEVAFHSVPWTFCWIVPSLKIYILLHFHVSFVW